MHSTAMKGNNTSLSEELYEGGVYREGNPLNQHSHQQLDTQPALYMAVCLMATIILIGGIGNIMVILAVRTTKKLQTASNAFVVNLSVCDLVFVIIILPFNIYTYLTDGWDLPFFLCKLIGFLAYTLTGTTILTITMIAFNRYKLVVDSQCYQQCFRRRNLFIMLAFTWLFPACLLLPAVFEKWGQFGYVTMMVTCNLLLDHDSQSFKLFLLVVRAAIPCVLIVFFYLRIYAATKASHRRVLMRRRPSQPLSRMDQMIQRKEMHLTKMMATIFVVFALSYFPCTISSIVDWNTVLSKRFHMFCLITVYVGSAVNPLVYGLMNSQFRCAYYSILLCRCLSSMPIPDDLLPTTSTPSPASLRRRSAKLKSNKTPQARSSRVAKKQQQPKQHKHVPVAITDNSSHSPLASTSRESTDDPQYSPQTVHSLQTKVHMYRKLSVNSNGSISLSQQDTEEVVHFNPNQHRTNTEKPCLEDCDQEEGYNNDSFQA